MVTQVTSFSRNGVGDWYLQRMSSIVIAIYTVLLVGIIVMTPEWSFERWAGLFDSTLMKIATLLVILATCVHAWIGMWTIGTDYLRARTMGPIGDTLRSIYQLVCVLAILSYLIWGIQILWGN
ncbi:MAG: succinate dehydrogenase, hydrophobic membrane anchor protein [Pseudomonadales bacterium]|jgi:succinate dehydrogenase / fumarate reductase membrane anchor subunit